MRENTRQFNELGRTTAWTQAAVAHTPASGRYTAVQHDIAMDRLLEDLIAMGDEETATQCEPKLRLTAPMTQADLVGTGPSATGQMKIACLA